MGPLPGQTPLTALAHRYTADNIGVRRLKETRWRERGVRVLAAGQALAGELGMIRGFIGPMLMLYEQALQKAREKLDSATVDAALQEGQALTMDQALQLARETSA